MEDLEDEITINDTQVDGARGNGPTCSKITYVADEAHMEPFDGGMQDKGGFTMGEICVALGKQNLDEERFTRLKEGWHLLMDQCLGRV